MKFFLNTLVLLCVTSLFCQVSITNDIIPVDNSTTDYTLINDFQGLDFDQEKSRISFDFIEEETSGTIGGLNFKVNFNPNDIDNAVFKGTAMINTLDTNNFLRDGHLMWEKFFYKKKHPTISFVSTQVVSFDVNTYKVIGNLIIKGIQKEVIITFSLDEKKLLGKTTIYTSDFGVSIHDEREKNKLDVRFYFPIIK
ncbi:YceI family protein [Aquimarina sp. AU474]|uniref:YceI family protein n=1 Tax=Aquimarina sp. AU474 TaxID=2108529 RepID=UPI000D6908BE|nr:YceI family protein [Aquimarina sp. AU474]